MARRSKRRRPPKVQTRRTPPQSRRLSEAYWDVTQRPLQCLVFLLPLVVAYEVGMAMIHGRLPARERPTLAAQQMLEWFFSLFGATGYYLPGFLLVIVLILWHLVARHPWKVSLQPAAGMAGESVLLAIPLLLLNNWLPVMQARALQADGTSHANGRIDNLLLSIGAGLYEELVFRLIVITLLMLLLKDILRLRERWGVALAVIVSSLLFAAHHYQPIGADDWSVREFAFRAAAGAYLAAVFVIRGFGLAVGCHVIYDIIAFLL